MLQRLQMLQQTEHPVWSYSQPYGCLPGVDFQEASVQTFARTAALCPMKELFVPPPRIRIGSMESESQTPLKELEVQSVESEGGGQENGNLRALCLSKDI